MRTHGNSDKSFFPSPICLFGSVIPMTEHIMECHRDAHCSSFSNRFDLRATDSYIFRAVPHLPTNPSWTLRALGTELQSQQKRYGSSLPSPRQEREGSHAEGEILTLCLNSVFSSKVMVSALAITGMMFTTLLRCFMNSRSKGRRLQPKKEQHGRGHFTLLALLVTLPASGHL